MSALAASSEDSDAPYERFYEEVKGFRVSSPGPGLTRIEFVALVMPDCRAFVETLAATLATPSGSEYAGERRAEEVNMATLLLADACWKRYVRPSDETLPSLIDPT